MNIRNLIKVIANTIFFFFLLSCSNSNTEELIYLSGSIRPPLVKQLKSQNKPNAKIILSSRGGLPNQAILAAKSIQRNDNNLVVQGVCFSACAEYLLPVAFSIEFRDSPLVGFHWNPIMTEYLMRENAKHDVELCTFSDSKALKKLQLESGVNSKFWKETFVRLGEYDYHVEYQKDACPWRSIKFENHMWLPTSKQLRELYWLKFTGSVCADNLKTCKKKIDRRWKKGRRIVVGDTLYISKGHPK